MKANVPVQATRSVGKTTHLRDALADIRASDACPQQATDYGALREWIFLAGVIHAIFLRELWLCRIVGKTNSRQSLHAEGMSDLLDVSMLVKEDMTR